MVQNRRFVTQVVRKKRDRRNCLVSTWKRQGISAQQLVRARKRRESSSQRYRRNQTKLIVTIISTRIVFVASGISYFRAFQLYLLQCGQSLFDLVHGFLPHFQIDKEDNSVRQTGVLSYTRTTRDSFSIHVYNNFHIK